MKYKLSEVYEQNKPSDRQIYMANFIRTSHYLKNKKDDEDFPKECTKKAYWEYIHKYYYEIKPKYDKCKARMKTASENRKSRRQYSNYSWRDWCDRKDEYDYFCPDYWY